MEPVAFPGIGIVRCSTVQCNCSALCQGLGGFVLKDNLLTKCHKRVRNGRARAIRTRTPHHARTVHAIKFCAPTKNFAIDPKAALKRR